MRIIEPYIIQVSPKIDQTSFLKRIESIGRVCYKSENKITVESAEEFVVRLIKNKHEAMIEHAENISIKFICDRGVSHEIVRHRLFSFAQESTRYCNYERQNEITVIKPIFYDEGRQDYELWRTACIVCEDTYLTLIKLGASPQEARSVLPNSLKTEIVVTGNIREWRHFFKLRLPRTAHPQMRQVAGMAFDELYDQIPIMFKDIKEIRDA